MDTDNNKTQAAFRPGIEVVRGSVVEQHVDAIVNAANCSLLGGGGVDGAIHAAAGPQLLAECAMLGGCETGSAKITKAYNIRHAHYIIHAVGPVYYGKPQDAVLLAGCYSTALDLALAHGCRSIAFPCISTGIYGYPIDEAAAIAMGTVRQWRERHPEALMTIRFCCFREVEYTAYTARTGV